MGTTHSRSLKPSPGTRTKSHDPYMHNKQPRHLPKRSHSEKNVSEKLLEYCYETNIIPEELKFTTSESFDAIRSLQSAFETENEQCNCTKYLHENTQNIHASELSLEDLAHIATKHKSFYRSLKLSKQRSERFNRLDVSILNTHPLNMQRTKSANILTSVTTIHENYEFIEPKIELKPLPLTVQQSHSGLCSASYTCFQFQKLCNAYRDLTQKPSQDYSIKYKHCVQYHVDDYPDECDMKQCQYDADSTELSHIIHGHWFHKHPLHRLKAQRKFSQQRRRNTSSCRYAPLVRKSAKSIEVTRVTSSSAESARSIYDYVDEFRSEGDGELTLDDDHLSIDRDRSINIVSLRNALNDAPMSDDWEQLQFGAPFSVKKSEARFNNPKQEILGNGYKKLTKFEWNSLLKKSVGYVGMREAKYNKLNMKEIVALKLYTDYDALQNHYRRCFRLNERERQKHFYWWNQVLVSACGKSQDIITDKVYHGVNSNLTLSTFCGTYYGPVSTTTVFDIAKQFAGSDGKIIELYPSFGRNGLKVAWLSNFPDEDEILYMNTSFQIHDIYHKKFARPRKSFIGGLNATNEDQSYEFEKSVMKAIQSINIESKVISLNAPEQHNAHNIDKDEIKEEDDVSGFIDLSSKAQLAVLYLLYLQYRKKEWDEFLTKTNVFVKNAFEKFRAEFVLLAENVKAVKMERLSQPLQIFFYTTQKEYTFPIEWYDRHAKYEFDFKPNQSFRIDTIVRLFPNAEQISINAENWDFSLNNFIKFLDKFDMDYADVKLQDIFIKFTPKQFHKTSYDIVTDNEKAQFWMIEAIEAQNINASEQLSKLRKLGWKFVNNSHLHRASCEPTPELPFVTAFCKPRSNTRFFYRSYTMCLTSQQIQEINTLHDPGMHGMSALNEDEPGTSMHSKIPDSPEAMIPQTTETEVDEEVEEGIEDMERNLKYVVIQHNPINCVLSKDIFDVLSYKDKVMVYLRNTVQPQAQDVDDEDPVYRYWLSLCDKVEILVLDPMSDVLKEIFMFYRKNQTHRGIISFKNIYKLFDNVQEVFLRNTVLNLRICYKFTEFIKMYGNESKLERVFFSKEINDKDVPNRHIMRFNLVLNPYSWTVNIFEHCIQKYSA